MNITATLFGQILTFVFLIWFINRFLWEPLTNMMEERKKRIADGLAASERGLHEKELAEKKAIEILQVAKQEANDVIARAQRRSNEIIEEAKRDAKAENERLLHAANASIDQEVNRAKEELRQHVATLAISAAEKILQKEINADIHAEILNETIAQI